MHVEKNDARVLLAIASGRVSAAKQSVADLESMMNDIKIKLDRANDELTRSEHMYETACGILEK